MSNDETIAEYGRRICRAVDYITANLTESLSVDEIAQAAPFSKYHFQRLFKAVVGETVAEFTRRLRLERAATRLIFNPQADITAIAIDLGFSSSQNFAKAFRKQFEMSPSEYRETNSVDNQPSRTVIRTSGNADSTNGNTLRTAGNAGQSDSTYDSSTLLNESKNRSSEMSVEVKTLPSIRVAYVRHFGSYDDPGTEQAFQQLRHWAEPRGLHDASKYLGIPWDNPDVTDVGKCRFDACLMIDEHIAVGPNMNVQIIDGGKYAVYPCEVVGRDFDRPWTQLLRDWLPGSGYLPADGYRFEVYHNDGDEDTDSCWKLDVCLPVMPL